MGHKMFRYTVEGAGTFPYDMLRYDASYPDSQTDSVGIDKEANHKRRQVTLIHDEFGPRGRTWAPTADRWASFLWKVIESGEVA
jgi:hypothetical protein